MSKPILWLGPLEELDADFDPLLGRSAAALKTQTGLQTSKPTLDPSRSVFDDPAPDVTTPIANDTSWTEPDAEHVPEVVPEQVLTNELAPEEPSTELVPDPVSESTPEPVAEIIDAAPVVEPVSEPVVVAEETTDYAHNNDPIPASVQDVQDVQETAPADGASTFSPAFDDDFDEWEEPKEAAPKKSFFTNLFSRRTIVPAAAGTGASINEIWAKSEPAPEPNPEAFVEPEAQLGPEPDVTAVPDDDIELEVAQVEPLEALDAATEAPEAAIPEPEPESTATPLRGRNIWEDIDDEPAEDSAIAALSPEPETASQDQVTPEPVPEPEPEPEAFVEAVTEEPMLVPAEPSEETSIPEASSLEPVQIDGEPLIEERVEDAVEDQFQEETPEDVPVATAGAPNFQKAFNADQFWALPKGTNPSHPENAPDTTPTIDTTPQEVAPEASEPELDPIAAATTVETPKVRQPASGMRRKKKVKKSYVGAFFGTFLFGIALIMTLVSSLAAFGYPFDLMSSYRWYWVILAVLSAGIFGISRGWRMVAAAFAVVAVNLFVTVPASGKAPTGGNTATAVVGWANVSGNAEALARVFKDADKKKATLLMLAEAPQSVFTPPAGWTLIEAPAAGDPTAIAVLSKSTWRAATVPGEPTMARPPAGDLTIIGVHPQDAIKSRRSTPNRDALINRAGTRAGIQEGPTVVLGDFNAAPWDRAMSQFRSYGNVTRVRCGGWAGSTLTQAFGLIGVATDHAYVRDVKVTHCQLGNSLTGGNHKPIWLYVAPQPAPPAEAVQP